MPQTPAPSYPNSPTAHELPSYLQADHLGPWGVYLQQVDRVIPYLGPLARWAETLKRPKRALIVDGRNLYRCESMQAHGFDYASVGRATARGAKR